MDCKDYTFKSSYLKILKSLFIKALWFYWLNFVIDSSLKSIVSFCEICIIVSGINNISELWKYEYSLSFNLENVLIAENIK